jgi:hypothetical protein
LANRWHDMSLADLMQTMGQSQPGSIDHGYATAEFNRRQFLGSNRSAKIAVIATVTAMLSALASVAGAISARNEGRISATMDIDRKHLTDPLIGAGRQLAVLALRPDTTNLFSDQKGAPAWNEFILDADYIARLLDKRRLDRDYMTDATVCDIWLASVATLKLPKKPGPTSPLEAVGKSLETECKPTFNTEP